jgi:soluble lytic murein transglycosylase-like protein
VRAKWNVQSLLRRQICQEWFRSGVARSLLVIVGIVASFLAFPVAQAILQNDAIALDSAAPAATTDTAAETSAEPAAPQTAAAKPQPPSEPKSATDRSATISIENLLARYDVKREMLTIAARAIVTSSRKHKVDPRLLASIMIVESGADPNAVSSSGAIGIMQIHLPTWGAVADRQGMDLFKVEDNVDMGARILRDYIVESGVWEGVMRYKGWIADNPASQQSAQEYALKVRQIYES